ncbi:MAG TPA: hypothetical protein VHC90_20050 [Bryobacteraceae bacterium]|nr:hypothetical protein [Bryobacteraceae bacterium]
MKQFFLLFAWTVLLVLAACGAVSMTDPNNHIWTGTHTFNSTVNGTQPWNLELVSSTLGFTSQGGITLGSGGSGGNSSISCSNSSPCLTINQAGSLAKAISVTAGSVGLVDMTSSGTAAFSGTINYSGPGASTGDVVCFKNNGFGFPIVLGHASVTGGSVGTCN